MGWDLIYLHSAGTGGGQSHHRAIRRPHRPPPRRPPQGLPCVRAICAWRCEARRQRLPRVALPSTCLRRCTRDTRAGRDGTTLRAQRTGRSQRELVLARRGRPRRPKALWHSLLTTMQHCAQSTQGGGIKKRRLGFEAGKGSWYYLVTSARMWTRRLEKRQGSLRRTRESPESTSPVSASLGLRSSCGRKCERHAAHVVCAPPVPRPPSSAARVGPVVPCFCSSRPSCAHSLRL